MNKKEVKEKVLEVIEQYASDKELYLPMPIKDITKSFKNVRLIKYSTHIKRTGISLQDMYDVSKDAYTDYNATTNQYIVYYNDIDKNIISSYRYRWNIAHELGHIVLNHHKNTNTRIFRRKLSDSEYDEMEEEADWFAAYILVPHIIVYSIQRFSNFSLKAICHVSKKAESYRIDEFNLWKLHRSINKYDKKLLKLYSHKKICKTCKSIVDDNFKYCHICGNGKIMLFHKCKYVKQGDDNVKYKEIDFSNGCPICHNEDIVQNAKYCHICGVGTENKCLGVYDEYSETHKQCDEAEKNPIPSNARFCPYCGSETTFYRKEILIPWQKENFNLEDFEVIKDDDIPF